MRNSMLFITLVTLLLTHSMMAQANNRSYTIFSQMYEQSATEAEIDISVNGEKVSFGGEKEGSSSKITRVMSPTMSDFKSFLEGNPEFARIFLDKFASGAWRARNVIDISGQTVDLDRPEQYRVGANEPIQDAILRWVEAASSSPFSFINQSARTKIFKFGIKGEAFQGINRSGTLAGNYDSWEAIKGDPEKYIDKGHKELNGGWELILKPMETYGAFERQIRWLRETLADRVNGRIANLFEPPGHQRVRIPKQPINATQKTKMAELARSIQSYIVLKELAGNTGILISKWKALATDAEFTNFKSGRSVIRLEQDRFGGPSWLIEFRSGVKTEATRRFVHSIFTSRMTTLDFTGLSKLGDYSLRQVSQAADLKLSTGEELVTQEELEEALNRLRSVRHNSRSIKTGFLVPLWNWHDAPFAKNKADHLKKISAEFIKKINSGSSLSYQKTTQEMQRWVRASYLIEAIEGYVTPKRAAGGSAPAQVRSGRGIKNVNKIDLGLEFTTRMPIKAISELNSNGSWKSSIYKLTPDEIAKVLEKVANDLAKNMGLRNTTVSRVVESGGHGHDLSVAYEFEDSNQRTWRVEWDGIAREYDRNGEVIPESVRGGHIEIVTPKKNIKYRDIKAVFNTYKNNGIRPARQMGGTHINIDMEQFNQKPEQLARFLTLFHQHRGIITFMFQSIERTRNAEPVNLSSTDYNKIKNFAASGNAEADATKLARILYNAHYFNDRVGRKTRYTHWDLSNFFGRVIPQQFIKPDFNVVRVRTGHESWHRQFRVGPHQKMEGRFFDAPVTEMESVLALKLVRAMLHQTLNSTTPLTGQLSNLSHTDYAADPEKAYQDLEKLMSVLDLKAKNYRGIVSEKLVYTRQKLNLRSFVPHANKVDRENPRHRDWGRSNSSAHSPQIYSEDRAEELESAAGRMCGRSTPN